MIRALLLLALLACSGHAATWYVSTTGNDTTGTGSEGNPWRTIVHGINSMSGGDTLLIRAGTYEEQPYGTSGTGIETKSGLSNAQRTVIRAYPGEAVVWKTSTAGRVVQSNTGGPVQYMTWSGLTLEQSFEGGNLMRFDNVNHVTLTNMVFRNSLRGSMTDFNSRSGYPGFPGGNIHVVDCLFTNMHNTATQTAASHHTYWGQQTDVLFERNVFADGMVHPDNTGLSPVAIMGGGALCARWTVRNNYITNVAHGIRVDGVDHVYYNNVIVNARKYSIPVRGSNTFAANNTIYAAAGSGEVGRTQIGIYVEKDDGRNARLVNNIVWGSFGSAAARVVAWEGGTRSTFWTNNIIGPGTANFTANDIRVGNLNADPLFVSVPTDWNIQDTSPARAAAVTLASMFTTDFTGATRTVPWDIGAYALASEDPPPLPLLTIVADGEHAFEATLTPQTFTVTREGNTAGALNVNFSVAGTAVAGTHYTALVSPLTIADGVATGTLTVQPLTSGVEDDRTVVVTLTSGDYTLGSTIEATITIVHASTSGGLAAPGRLRAFGPL